MVRYYIHNRCILNNKNTDVTILKDTEDGRIYEINLCPTISASVFLNKEEAKRHGGNHHIFGTIQINTDKDFDEIWNAVIEVLEKRKAFHPLKIDKEKKVET